MNFGELLMSNSMFGEEDDPKDPKNPFAKEMRVLSKKNLPFDNKNALDLVRASAKQTGIDPYFLYSSAFSEGMNKAIAKPDEVSEAYINAKVEGDYPVDAFFNYGVDKFSEYLPKIQKYLPKGFENSYKLYPAKNEIGEDIQTAAFRTNQDALTAKAAIMMDTLSETDAYAKEKGIQLDDVSRKYFALARYNASPSTFKAMVDEYATSKDKEGFIKKGVYQNKYGGKVHKNIYPRIENMSVAQSLLDENPLGNK